MSTYPAGTVARFQSEPGLWGVVEAGHRHLGDTRAKFTRIPEADRPGVHWFDTTWESDFASWSDLIDPVLIREGVSDADAK